MAQAKKSSTQKGLGWVHQQRRASLLRQHRDGSPCPCTDCGPGCPCRAAGLPLGQGLPMWKDPDLNVDRRPLEADHVVGRSLGGTVADRLLLMTCNRSRGNGARRTSQQVANQKDYWSREW